MKPSLSIVIPAYNEEKRIYSTILRLFRYVEHDNLFGKKELIIVENGSTDKTNQQIKWGYEDGCFNNRNNWPDFYIYHSDKGKGVAVKEGIKRARGAFILITDADLSTSIGQVRQLYLEIDKGPGIYGDIVIGSRRAPGAHVYGQSYTRRLSSWAFNQWSRILLPEILDTQCGFKLLRWEPAQEIAKRLTLTGYAFDVEMLYIAHKLGYEIKEVPVKWIDSEGSKINVIRDSIKMVSDIVKIMKNSAAYDEI